MNFLFSFNGRINRLQWWLAQLIVSPISLFVQYKASAGTLPLTTSLALLALLAPALWIQFAVCAKRYHDRGKSALWLLITFIPIIGPVWITIECGFLAGTAGPNRFGDNTSDQINSTNLRRVGHNSHATPQSANVRNPLRNEYGRVKFGRRMA